MRPIETWELGFQVHQNRPSVLKETVLYQHPSHVMHIKKRFHCFLSNSTFRRFISTIHSQTDSTEERFLHRERLVTGLTTSTRWPSNDTDPIATSSNRMPTPSTPPPHTHHFAMSTTFAPILLTPTSSKSNKNSACLQRSESKRITLTL